jgi:hypothetical protein
MSRIIGVTVGTPTSPSRIEEAIKPIKTVNGIGPDENGNVEIAGGGSITTDPTFSISGAAADAAAVGEALAEAQGVFEAFGQQIQANAEAVAKIKLPVVTAEDNGKFLRVTDGAWAAVSIEAAEGASF